MALFKNPGRTRQAKGRCLLMEEIVSAEMLHAQTQVGYLLLKLKAEEILTKKEVRRTVEKMFPVVRADEVTN